MSETAKNVSRFTAVSAFSLKILFQVCDSWKTAVLFLFYFSFISIVQLCESDPHRSI